MIRANFPACHPATETDREREEAETVCNVNKPILSYLKDIVRKIDTVINEID